MSQKAQPWYNRDNQDAIFYLLIAVFFLEMIVGGVAFFYGIIHAVPEKPGGPPLAQFPWFAWAISAFLAPVALLLIFHLAGTLLTRSAEGESQGADQLPDSMKKFYAAVRHAPTIVILLAILILGGILFFMDGALAVILELGKSLLPYLPWILCSLCFLFAAGFAIHAILAYRQRKLDYEYAWRREVLEKTGMVITDRNTIPLENRQTAIDIVALPDQPPSLPAGKSDDS